MKLSWCSFIGSVPPSLQSLGSLDEEAGGDSCVQWQIRLKWSGPRLTPALEILGFPTSAAALAVPLRAALEGMAFSSQNSLING